MGENEPNPIETPSVIKKKRLFSKPVNAIIIILAIVRVGIDMWDWIINPGFFPLGVTFVTILGVFLICYAQHWTVAFVLVKSYEFIRERKSEKVKEQEIEQ